MTSVTKRLLCLVLRNSGIDFMLLLTDAEMKCAMKIGVTILNFKRNKNEHFCTYHVSILSCSSKKSNLAAPSLYCIFGIEGDNIFWACLVEGFNTLATAGVLNLPDKQVDPGCWLRSGFESPGRQLGFKPLSGSFQLRTLHCRATLICASFGGLIIYYHFPK